MEFNVPQMSCGHCAGAITRAVKAADPDAVVAIDLGTKTVRVESSTARIALAAAIAEAGYATA